MFIFLRSCLNTAETQRLCPLAPITWCRAQEASRGHRGAVSVVQGSRLGGDAEALPESPLPRPSQHLLLPDVPWPWRVPRVRSLKTSFGKDALVQLDSATGVFLWVQGFAYKRSLFEMVCSAASEAPPGARETLPLHSPSLRFPQEGRGWGPKLAVFCLPPPL